MIELRFAQGDEVTNSNQTIGFICKMELLARFELATSSLPRMRSTD